MPLFFSEYARTTIYFHLVVEHLPGSSLIRACSGLQERESLNVLNIEANAMGQYLGRKKTSIFRRTSAGLLALQCDLKDCVL